MPLLDHFHPPLSQRRHWDSFFGAWAEAMALLLNQELLPAQYFAEARIKLKTGLPYPPPELFEVQVLEGSEGPRPVGAIELVSPANKDRPGTRQAFAEKCGRYLQEEVGLVVVDVVTERTANLHRELLNLCQRAAEEEPQDDSLYAAAYRTVASGEEWALEAWLERLALGAGLPTLPLWIAPDRSIALDLEQTYQMACIARRIG